MAGCTGAAHRSIRSPSSASVVVRSTCRRAPDDRASAARASASAASSSVCTSSERARGALGQVRGGASMAASARGRAAPSIAGRMRAASRWSHAAAAAAPRSSGRRRRSWRPSPVESGASFRVAPTMTPSVPSEPIMSAVRSSPVTPFTVRWPVRDAGCRRRARRRAPSTALARHAVLRAQQPAGVRGDVAADASRSRGWPGRAATTGRAARGRVELGVAGCPARRRPRLVDRSRRREGASSRVDREHELARRPRSPRP